MSANIIGDIKMKNTIKTARSAYLASCRYAESFIATVAQKYGTVLLFVLGLALLSGGLAEFSIAQSGGHNSNQIMSLLLFRRLLHFCLN
jgi:hypothetical protein